MYGNNRGALISFLVFLSSEDRTETAFAMAAMMVNMLTDAQVNRMIDYLEGSDRGDPEFVDALAKGSTDMLLFELSRVSSLGANSIC